MALRDIRRKKKTLLEKITKRYWLVQVHKSHIALLSLLKSRELDSIHTDLPVFSSYQSSTGRIRYWAGLL